MLIPAKKLLCRQKLPCVPSQGTMSPSDDHHAGKAIKAEKIAISQANTSVSKASTDINLLECPEIKGVHGESFNVTKQPTE